MTVSTNIASSANIYFGGELVPTNSAGDMVFAIAGTLSNEVISRLSRKLSRKPMSFQELIYSCDYELLRHLATDVYLLVIQPGHEKQFTNEVRALELWRQGAQRVLLIRGGALILAEKMSEYTRRKITSNLPSNRILKCLCAFDGVSIPGLTGFDLTSAFSAIALALEQVVEEKVKVLLKLAIVDTLINGRRLEDCVPIALPGQTAYLIGGLSTTSPDSQSFILGTNLTRDAFERLLGLVNPASEFRELIAGIKPILDHIITDTYALVHNRGGETKVKAVVLCSHGDRKLLLTRGGSMPIVREESGAFFVLDNFVDEMSDQYPGFKLGEALYSVRQQIANVIRIRAEVLGVLANASQMISTIWAGGKQS